MADIIRVGSGVPRILLRRTEELIDKLEALKADAAAQGFGTVGYFLDAALSEVRYQIERHAEEREISNKSPDELWLPARGEADG